MEILNSEKKLCLICMQEHDVQTVMIQEENEFKGERVNFDAIYEYCENEDQLLETEELQRRNDISFKDAYRSAVGLLTSKDIASIRAALNINQKDFSMVLGCGQATIARYESHQVQDCAYNNILRRIQQDPEWFVQLLEQSKEKLTPASYEKALKAANQQYTNKLNFYVENNILAKYAQFLGDNEICGNVSLNIPKIVEMVNYLAERVPVLLKVKLMKLLWYADNLNYKRYGSSISGLAYCAYPMGALPIGHDLIPELAGISYEFTGYDNGTGYKFIPADGITYSHISDQEIQVLETVADRFRDIRQNEIVDIMHNEVAYKETAEREVISYKYAQQLSID